MGIVIINKFTFYQYQCTRFYFVSRYDFMKHGAPDYAKIQIYYYLSRFFFFFFIVPFSFIINFLILLKFIIREFL